MKHLLALARRNSAPFTAIQIPCGTLRAFLALVIMLGAVPARAAEPISLHARTARELAELCNAPPRQAGSDAKINYCHGFAQGAVDVALQQSGDKKLFCFPNPAPRRTETMSEFAGWVRSLPEHQRLSATDGLLQFLGQRYPCTK